VLATVSSGCPEPKARFSRFTHPSATQLRKVAFDLHVLSIPPAFILSQDQTLRFVEFFDSLAFEPDGSFDFLFHEDLVLFGFQTYHLFMVRCAASEACFFLALY